MIFKKLKIEGLVLIRPAVFTDERGFFLESYNKRVFAKNGIDVDFVQDNHSRSGLGVLRGLHFQRPPFAQDKLVRVTRGEIFDVAVDVRPSSSTFGHWKGVILSEKNKRMFFIPKGFAHGFLTLSDIVDFQYKVSNFYSKESEGGVVWNDPTINIKWPIKTEIILLEKDRILPQLEEVKEQLKKIWKK